MNTFFSGTDTATLKEEGRDRNNFVSLIVNNAGTYTAAITRRIKSKQVKESVSYEFFGDGEKHDTKEYVSDADEIEWFYLKIEKEGENYSFPDMAARLEEIKQAKEERAKKTQIPVYQGGYKPVIANSYGIKTASANIIKNEEKPTTQKTLFNKEGEPSFQDMDSPIAYGYVHVDKKTIESIVKQLITCSILIPNESKIDINKWVMSMPALYQKRFGNGEEGMMAFESWANTLVEYLTWEVEDAGLEEMGFDQTDVQSICAHDLIEALTKLPENEYIKVYIDELEKYLVL